MPPAIQRTITRSAVGLIFSAGAAASSERGALAARAASVAADAVFRKSRREQRSGRAWRKAAWAMSRLMFMTSVVGLGRRSTDQLKLRQHGEAPEQVLYAVAPQRRSDQS